MTLHKPIQLNAQISEEAAEWFVEFRTGEVDATARRAFDTWVRTSPEHLRAYLEVAAIWNEGQSLDARRTLDTETLIALSRSDSNVHVLSSSGTEAAEPDLSPPRPPLRSIPRVRFRLAASIAAVSLAAGAFVLWSAFRAPTYATDVGEERSLRLPDGSTVELNSRSRLRIAFTDAERTVDLLQGQALFRVTHNPERPFIVRTASARVRAVGTQFDVDRQSTATVVTVIEGKVAVTGEGRAAAFPSDTSPPDALPTPIFLVAGEQLALTPHGLPHPQKTNVAAATAWIQRQIVLDSAPLSQVAAEFSRYSTRRLVAEDDGPHPLRLSGVFSTDPDFLIHYLRERSDITIEESDTEIRIVRHAAPPTQ